MTTTTGVQLPAITCPSSLIASCPPLLGFQPERSLICVAHNPGVPRPVVARVTLVDDDEAEACATDLARRLARAGRSQVTIVVWLDAPDDAMRADLPGTALVEHVERSLLSWGIAVDFAVATNGTVWWPLLCSDPACCTGVPRLVDPDIAGRVRLQYAVAGFAPLAGRSALVERLVADPDLVARTRAELAEPGPGSRSLAHRRRLVDEVWAVLRPMSQPPGSRGICDADHHLQESRRLPALWPADAAEGGEDKRMSRAATIRALDDAGVRDALLVRMAEDEADCRACWSHSIAVLVDVVRGAPPGRVAPAATLLGLAAWLSGDGALATVAVERALQDDPAYRLALLCSQLFGSGLAPSQWRASVASLTEEECLRRTGRVRRRASP